MSGPVEHRILLNFAASPIGGGFKRLYEYARWFDGHGGAWFIVHPQRASLAREFPRNRYFVAGQSVLQRLVDDAAYLPDILRQTGTPDCYYSYGIPIPSRCGHLNWFHLSNVLPLGLAGIPSPLKFRIKFGILGWKIRRRLHLADVVSAESRNSLRLMGAVEDDRHVVSVNGSDDELRLLQEGQTGEMDNIATVVGTYWYKGLEDSYHVFDMLRKRNPGLTLVVIGDHSPGARAHGMAVPERLRGRPDIRLAGALPRTEVMAYLRRSRYYISTTRVENSWNAASEGAFFVDESYLSDLGPHRELLEGVPFTEEAVPGVSRALLHVRREQMSGANLKTWDTVVAEMLDRMTAGKAG